MLEKFNRKSLQIDHLKDNKAPAVSMVKVQDSDFMELEICQMKESLGNIAE